MTTERLPFDGDVMTDFDGHNLSSGVENYTFDGEPYFGLTGYVPVAGSDGSILEPTRETLKRRKR